VGALQFCGFARNGRALSHCACAVLAVLPQFSAWRLAAIRGSAACLCDGQETVEFMQIIVRDNNVDQALRALKKKLQREGVYREMKLRRHYEKPSEKRARERAAAVRRARKMERKRMERDGIK
jgi:small subunit ribosomal protein S21